jgi:RimJ/RimL family protein N-acetyltransferase
MQDPILSIVGERVALGPLERAHLPHYLRWINDFPTLRSLAIPPGPMTLEQEAGWFERAATGDMGITFTIYALPDNRPIGNTMLRDIDHRHRTAEFAIMIGEASERGKGYGTEATRLMLDYAFTALGLNNVMLSVYAFNLAGKRAYEKAGFRECGRRRQARWMGGTLWDVIYMECLASEFSSPVLGRIFVPDRERA